MLHPHYTIRATLRKDTKNAKDLCQIAVVITSEGKRRYESTGLRVLESQWTEATGKVRNHPNAAILNGKISELLIKAEGIFLGAAESDFNNDKSFLAYAEDIAKSANVSENTRRRWFVEIKILKEYQSSVTFAQITPQWLHKYLRHRNESTAMNTSVKSLQFMRRMFNEAKKDGTTTLYPFADYKVPAEKSNPREYLTIEEIDELEALFEKDLPEALRTTLAYFLLECYSGTRFSDWRRWEVERLDQTDSLKVTTAKTGAPIYIPIGAGTRLRRIIDRISSEHLVFKESLQEANRKLKTLSLLAGISKTVTTHIGRHTAATLLLEKGFSRETVAEVLGVTIKVIDIYAKMTRQKVKQEFARLGGL